MYTEKQNLWEIAGEDMSSVADICIVLILFIWV